MPSVDIFITIVMGLSLIISIVSAAFLVYKDVDGWGWFLFIAFIIATNIHG